MPNRSISFLIHCLDHQISQRNNRRLSQIDLTLPQAVVLDFLFWRQRETVNQRSLEKFMQLSNPSVAGRIFEETNEMLAEILGPEDREVFRGLILRLEKSLIEEERDR